VSLARVLASQGRTAGAVKQCRAATRSAPGWAGAWCALGGALVDAGRLQAALRAYTRGLDCDGATWVASDGADDTAWQLRAGLGKIHLACHEYGEAADCLAGALALNPRSAELHLLLARAHEAVGRSLDAGRHLERAITIAPSAPQAYAAFGEFFTKKAETALLSGLAANTESRMLLERIERLRAARAIP
jgi:tetratricopeptide (TPR) repeat protein